MNKNTLLSEDERVILGNLCIKWEWIARDENGDLYIYEEKPEKRKGELGDVFWYPAGGYATSLSVFDHLFEFVKFDNEPYNIQELLKCD